jgi:dTDP-glucose pyrophosphorylase
MYTIHKQQSLKEALEMLNQQQGGLTLWVLDAAQRLVGVLTDADTRKAILGGKNLTASVEEVMNPQVHYLHKEQYSLADVDRLRQADITEVPVLEADGTIYKIANLQKLRSILPLDVIIMAGGRGERLRPLTDETPKPLLPVGGKPILEHSLNHLCSYGIDTLYLSVRYKSDKIKEWLGNGSRLGMHVNYLEEDKPLGTLGAASQVNGLRHEAILVMNSDLLTTIDLEDFYRSFLATGASMAVATTPYKVDVPYAVLNIDGEQVTAVKEKPTYTYYSNAGIYLIKKEVLQRIPHNQHYNAFELMEELIAEGARVTHFPILGYWLDIGRPEDYRKAQQDIKRLRGQG